MTTPAAVKRSRRQRPTGALSQHQRGRVVHHCARLTTLWRRAAAEVVATQGDAEEEDDEREGSGARFRFPTALGTSVSGESGSSLPCSRGVLAGRRGYSVGTSESASDSTYFATGGCYVAHRIASRLRLPESP